MNKVNPNKWIRKAVFDELDGVIIDSETIKVYDTRVTGHDIPLNYIVMSTQTNIVEKDNKCEWFWDASILLDITTTYLRPGNPGSRLLLDNITDVVRQAVNVLDLDPASGLSIITKTINISDLNTITENEIVFRSLFRLELLIK